MAINVSQAFHRTSANPIDESLALTKAQMVAVNDNLMPSKYLTVCQDDGKIYLYDKSNESDVSTGRFRELQAGSSAIIDPTPTQGSTNAVQSGGTYTALDGKVDKVTGKGLSTEDYTTAEQTKLSSVETGAEVNAIEGITLNGDTVTPDANRIIALTVITNTVNNLLNYYNKAETYTKAEVDALVSAVAGAKFESVSTLPTTDIKTNVIYLVPKQDPQAGDIKDEYINLDGTTSGWEHIGDTQVDLSNYVTKTELNTALADYTNTADLTTLLAGKVDKVTGKGLSTNDYTTEEKTKLAGLSNYDDTALSGRVSDIEDVVPSTATTSNKLATMADIGGTNGHTIEDSTGVDMTTRANLQFVGATVTDDSTNDRTVVAVDVSGKADKVANATSGNFAGLDSNGNLMDSGKKAIDFATPSDLTSKEDKFRYTTMPTASADWLNKIVTYTGTTSGGYTQNADYKCVAKGTSPETYEWSELAINSQDARIDDEIEGIQVRYDSSRQMFIPFFEIAALDLLTEGGRTPTQADFDLILKYYADGDITWSEVEPILAVSNLTSIDLALEMFETNKLTKTQFWEVWDVVGVEGIDLAYQLWKEGKFNSTDVTKQWNNAQITWNGATNQDITEVEEMYYGGALALSEIQKYWAAGNSRGISIDSTGSTATQIVSLKIADFNHDNLVTSKGGKTKALLTLAFEVSENGSMGGNSSTGWSGCALRTFMNGQMKYALPEMWRNMLKPVSRSVPQGGKSTASTTVQDSVFIPTVNEFIGRTVTKAETGQTSSFFNWYPSSVGTRYAGHAISGFRSKQMLTASAAYNTSSETTYVAWWQKANANNSGAASTGNASGGLMPHFCI